MAQINIPLDIESLTIIDQSVDKSGKIILDVVSNNKKSTCHKCGKPATKSNGKAPTRLIRHLPILDTPVYIRITPIRYSCESCDDNPTTTEQYDWCGRNASTTNGLEEYLMRCLINSTIEDVSRKEKIGSKVIQAIVDTKVNQKVNWKLFKSLDTIGVDEIALKKGHNSYVTIISTKTKSDASPIVIAVLDGKNKKDVKDFLQSIPAKLGKTVNQVCTDLCDGYVNAAIEVFGPQSLVVDRYHIAKLYRKPLDKLRIKEMARLKVELSKEEYAKLEGMMWVLRKKHECLSEAEKDQLALLYKCSPDLKQAHRTALKLTNIFNTNSKRKLAMGKINRWITTVRKSNLRIFDNFINTLEKYKPYIGNYFKRRKSSGFVEGLNNKIKVMKRRCYGVIKTTTIFQRLFLDLQGFECYA